MRKSIPPGRRFCLAFAFSVLIAGVARGAAPSPDPKEGADKGESASKAMVERRQRERRFYMALGTGTDFDEGATNFVHSARAVPRATSFAIPVGFTITSVTPRSIRAQSFADAYPYDFDNAFYRPRVEFGWVFNEHLEIFGNFAYTHADSRTLTVGVSDVAVIGVVPVPPPYTGGVRAMQADFGDYRSYGGEVGVRYFLLPPGARLRPYLSLSGGTTYVEAIGANLFTTTPDGTVYGQYRGGFYRGSWVGSATVLAGVEWSLNPAFSLTLEGGARYQSGLGTDRNAEGSLGRVFQGSTGDRLFCPLTLSAKVRF